MDGPHKAGHDELGWVALDYLPVGVAAVRAMIQLNRRVMFAPVAAYSDVEVNAPITDFRRLFL